MFAEVYRSAQRPTRDGHHLITKDWYLKRRVEVDRHIVKNQTEVEWEVVAMETRSVFFLGTQQLREWVLSKTSTLPRLDRVVLAVLCLHGDGQGFCFPSIETIARETGYCERSVGTALNSLEGSGLITRGSHPRSLYKGYFLHREMIRRVGTSLIHEDSYDENEREKWHREAYL